MAESQSVAAESQSVRLPQTLTTPDLVTGSQNLLSETTQNLVAGSQNVVAETKHLVAGSQNLLRPQNLVAGSQNLLAGSQALLAGSQALLSGFLPGSPRAPEIPSQSLTSGEASHHAHLEREKTRLDLQSLDKEPHPAAHTDHKGKPLIQRSVFDWIGDDITDVKLHQTTTAEEVATEHGIPERFLVRYLRGEIQEGEACQTLPFTLVLLVSFSIMAIAHDDATAVRSIEDSLENDIIENANFAFTGDYIGHKTMHDVNSFPDFWSWLRLGVVPLLFQQQQVLHEGYTQGYTHGPNFTLANISMAERGFWLHYNRIVGGLRMVQERDVPDGNWVMDRLKTKVEDIPGGNDLLDRFLPDEAECNTLDMLKNLYDSKCVGGLDYDLEPELGLPNERAKHTVDPKREEWLYIFKDTEEILDKLTRLELSSWLDKQTKKIEIAIASYNGEFGVHTLTRVNFYFSRGGHIWKLIIPSSQFADWHDRWYYGFYDGIWLCCIIYIAINEFFEIKAVVKVKGTAAIITEYLNLWNLADWLSVFGGVAIVIIFLASIAMRTNLNEELANIGSTHWTEWDTDIYKNAVAAYYTLLEQNCNYVRYLRLSLAVYPLFIVVRLFKSFSAQPKLALVTNTLASSTPDMLHFAIVFFSVFVTFAICGIILFGKELRAFTTAPRAILSCFRVMLGDISWEELSAIGRVEAMFWLWLFILIITMLMLNMILAIIMDNYEQTKADMGAAETLIEEGQQWYTRTMGKLNGTYVSLETVLDAVDKEKRRRQMRVGRSGSLTDMVSGFFQLSSSSRRLNRKDSEESADTSPKIDKSVPISTVSSSINFNSFGEKVDGKGDIIITYQALIDMVKSFKPAMQTKLSSKQAIEVIEGAVTDYYERHKQGAELDEVLQLVQKVNYRTKKLVKLAKRLHQLRDFGPVEELKWFGMDVEDYMKDVLQEREKELQEIAELQVLKSELSARLLRFDPNQVFPVEINNNKDIFQGKYGSGSRSSGAPSYDDNLAYDDNLDNESLTNFSDLSENNFDRRNFVTPRSPHGPAQETWI